MERRQETFSPIDVAKILEEHGFTANPAGLVTPIPPDFEFEGDSVAHLDINAEAVRNGSTTPDRPIRITFQRVHCGFSSSWEVKSVEELKKGVPSKALDRDPNFPKHSPWPEGGI